MIDKRCFNESTIATFCSKFITLKNEKHQRRFKYIRSRMPLKDTALSYSDGTPRKEIAQGKIGTKISQGTPSEKYLYDVWTYDSSLEQQNLLVEIETVVVYGKIPRKSIAIPAITCGTYSPDFMYIVKRKDETKDLNIIVETKDVEGKINLRGSEEAKIECAEVFFKMLSDDEYSVHFRKQLKNRQMA